MKPPPFAYARPETRDEVDSIMADSTGAKILAGGQSLVPMLNFRLVEPELLVDVNALQQEPAEPEVREDRVVIGPLVRHSAIERSDLVAEHVPLLHEAIRHVAHPAVRSRGTLVGSIAHADPASELPAVFVLLGGTAHVRSIHGTRAIPATEFFAGPLETSLAAGEWIEAVSFPLAREGEGFSLEEFARRHADYAICGVVARATKADGVTLCYFGIGETPRSRPVAVSVARLADELELADDLHATAVFRRHLAVGLGERAAARALGAA